MCSKHWPAHSPREGFYFLLDQKVTKNQVGKKASLPHQAFAPQIGQNHGLESFAPLRSLLSPLLQNSLCPQPHKATIVPPVSPEAALPTGKEKSCPFSRLVILGESEGSISELCISKLHVGDRCFTMFSMTKRSFCVRDKSGYRPAPNACVRMSG